MNGAFLKSEMAAVILIFFFTAGLFANTLTNDFTHDDFQVVKNSRFLNGEWKVDDLLNEGRVVRTLSLILDHKLFGSNPAGYHLQNIIWHTLNTILLYLFILKIAKDTKLALIISLLFASHPIHVEAVANISNRKDLLAFFFMFTSIMLYIGSYDKIGLRRYSRLFFSLISFIVALLSKQAAITLPMLVIAYEIYFVPRNQKRLILDNWRYLLPIIVLFIIYAFYHLEPISRFANPPLPYSRVLLASIGSISYYCQLLLWPVNLSAEHSVRIVIIRSLLSLFVLELLILYTTITKRSSGLFSFGLLWFVINLIPVSNLIPGTAHFFIAERYMYIPSVGFAIVTGIALQRISVHKEKAVPVLLAIIIVLFSINTVNRNTIWKNDLLLWTDNLKKYPDSVFSVIKIGDYYKYMGMPEKAVPYYMDALRKTTR